MWKFFICRWLGHRMAWEKWRVERNLQTAKVHFRRSKTCNRCGRLDEIQTTDRITMPLDVA